MGDSRNLLPTDHLQRVVASCLGRHTSPGQSIVVGLSGGIDSVVLLHGLRSAGAQISALHVHHGLSAFADHWADFCAALCTKWAIPFSSIRVTIERGSADGLEAAARRARHTAFRQYSADWVALGHHRGDRAETLLFNLVRGAGVRGAGAMGERNGRLLRPLLGVGREEILAYALGHGLTWVDDESNMDFRFSRNYLRHRIIPELSARFPGAEMCLARAAARFAEASKLLDDLAEVDLAGHDARFPVPVAVLAVLPEARARNVLRFLLGRSDIGVPSEERLAEALRQCLSAAGDRHPAVVFGPVTLTRRAGMVMIESK